MQPEPPPPALVCPETRQPLSPATEELLVDLRARVAAGRARNRAGVAVVESPEAALVREDGAIAYPVRGGVPILLAEEGIEL